MDWLVKEVGISPSAAEQMVEYLAAAKAALGVMPTLDNIVLERFFDDSGSMQLVLGPGVAKALLPPVQF